MINKLIRSVKFEYINCFNDEVEGEEVRENSDFEPPLSCGSIPCGKLFRRLPRGRIRSVAPNGDLMSKSGLPPSARIWEWNPLQIRPVWCPPAGGSGQSVSPTGY